MEEQKVTQTQVVYVRPSDIEAFMRLLPSIVGSYASKHTDAYTIRDLAIKLARETTSQLVALGICERTTVCLDNQPLATPNAAIAQSQPAALNLGNNNGHGLQGAMMAHYPTNDVQKVLSRG